jgi:diguanylate cyclase (GGDEF)-like protein
VKPPAASHPQPTALIDQLRLDQALQLLRHAGHPVAERPDASTPALLSTDWIQSVIDALCDLSSRDALTGLSNRRQLELAIDREIDRVARTGETTMILVLDIDHFKRVNDTHGHAAGDVVIQNVARALQECVRPMDTVARVGGEEFAIILPNCQPAFGQAVAERIRRRVESHPVQVSAHLAIPITVSAGGAFAPQWVRSSAKLWMERADQQLYRAKAEGRNRACLELPPLPMVSAEEKGMLFALGSGTPADPTESDPTS